MTTVAAAPSRDKLVAFFGAEDFSDRAYEQAVSKGLFDYFVKYVPENLPIDKQYDVLARVALAWLAVELDFASSVLSAEGRARLERELFEISTLEQKDDPRLAFTRIVAYHNSWRHEGRHHHSGTVYEMSAATQPATLRDLLLKSPHLFTTSALYPLSALNDAEEEALVNSARRFVDSQVYTTNEGVFTIPSHKPSALHKRFATRTSQVGASQGDVPSLDSDDYMQSLDAPVVSSTKFEPSAAVAVEIDDIPDVSTQTFRLGGVSTRIHVGSFFDNTGKTNYYMALRIHPNDCHKRFCVRLGLLHDDELTLDSIYKLYQEERLNALTYRDSFALALATYFNLETPISESVTYSAENNAVLYKARPCIDQESVALRRETRPVESRVEHIYVFYDEVVAPIEAATVNYLFGGERTSTSDTVHTLFWLNPLAGNLIIVNRHELPPRPWESTASLRSKPMLESSYYAARGKSTLARDSEIVSDLKTPVFVVGYQLNNPQLESTHYHGGMTLMALTSPGSLSRTAAQRAKALREIALQTGADSLIDNWRGVVTLVGAVNPKSLTLGDHIDIATTYSSNGSSAGDKVFVSGLETFSPSGAPAGTVDDVRVWISFDKLDRIVEGYRQWFDSDAELGKTVPQLCEILRDQDSANRTFGIKLEYASELNHYMPSGCACGGGGGAAPAP